MEVSKDKSIDAGGTQSVVQGTAYSLGERFSNWADASAGSILIWPGMIIVIVLSIFPLFISLYLALSRFQFSAGGIEAPFVGFYNFDKLLFGSGQRGFLGKFAQGNPGDLSPAEFITNLGPVEIILLLGFVGLMFFMMFRYVTSPRVKVLGIVTRLLAIFIGGLLAWVCISTLTGNGLPGSLVVTLIFVFGGVSLQYAIGLGLAMLLTQELPGKRFFRIAFLLPMMITPVGIGFLFRMLTDTSKGPFAPLWVAAGLGNYSWVSTGQGARLAIMIGDVWQWTPLMFIILLAALEGVSREAIEAALVDGANRINLFRYIILPQIIPVSTTLILIRIIEAFKIIDLPQTLTGGGPGTATETMTLQAYKYSRTSDLSGSAAQAYLLLFVVTFVAIVFVSSVRRRLLERL